MSIKIFTTGGTIDDYDYSSKKAPKSHKTFIPNLLKQSRITINYNIQKLMSKDSRFITGKDSQPPSLQVWSNGLVVGNANLVLAGFQPLA